MAAAKLPRIAVEPPENVIGTSTVGAMQSGVFWGYVGLIEGLVSRIQAEYGEPMTVIATGGLAPLFAKRCPVLQHIDRDLTMAGLLEMYAINRELIRSGKGPIRVKSFSDLRFVPLGGVGEIGVNCYLYGLAGRWTMVDLGHRLRRRPPAGRRHRPARPALHRAAALQSRRADPDPRPRGPYRRRALSVAAAGRADLVHAIHRRRAAREAVGDRFRARRADPHRRAGRGVSASAASAAASST